MPLGLRLGTSSRPYRFGQVQPLFDYHESRCDTQSVRVYDTTGAVAVRRVKVA